MPKKFVKYESFHAVPTSFKYSIKFWISNFASNIQIIFAGFGENRKSGSGVGRNENEIGSENLGSDSLPVT